MEDFIIRIRLKVNAGNFIFTIIFFLLWLIFRNLPLLGIVLILIASMLINYVVYKHYED